MSFGPPPSMYTESALTADKTRLRRRRRVLLTAAATTAAALFLGAGLLWYRSADQGDAEQVARTTHQAPDDIREDVEKAPVSPEGQIVTQHDEEKLSKNTDTNPRYAPGTWATGRIVARGVANRVEGYKIAPTYDETAWTLELDGHICATSNHVTADGRTAVVIQPPLAKGAKTRVCDQVVLFDLDTGEKVWQKKVPAADFAYVTNTNITLTKGVVAVAWGHGSVAYDMRTGERLWNTTTVSQCHDTGFAGGRALLALVTCGDGQNAGYRVEKLNPRTGKPRWTYKLTDGVSRVFLPNSDPPVVAVAAGDSDITDLITLDAAHGTRRATISMDGYDPKCGNRYFSSPFFGTVDKCDGLVVGRTRLYVMSKEDTGIKQPADRILAFDIAKGTSVGKFEGRPFQLVIPLRTSGDDLIVYRRSIDAVQPAAVLAWNPRTDTEAPYLLFHLPEDDESDLSDPEKTDIVYERGRVFFGPRELVRDDDKPTYPVLSVLGVGTAGLKH